MEEGVVEVGFGADGVEGAAVPTADLLDEVFAELGALLVLLRVVEVDLTRSAIILECSRLSTYLHENAKIRPDFR